MKSKSKKESLRLEILLQAACKIKTRDHQWWTDSNEKIEFRIIEREKDDYMCHETYDVIEIITRENGKEEVADRKHWFCETPREAAQDLLDGLLSNIRLQNEFIRV